jgi:hypothetical protein
MKIKAQHRVPVEGGRTMMITTFLTDKEIHRISSDLVSQGLQGGQVVDYFVAMGNARLDVLEALGLDAMSNHDLGRSCA